MADPPLTRPSLLVRIRDAKDTASWQQFVQLYAPLVYEFARKRGLQDADAADLTQDVLRAVTLAAGRLDYDPRRGSFRGWLFTIVHHKLCNFLASRKKPGQGTGDTNVHLLLEEQAGREQQEEALWNEEYERRLFALAVEQVRGDFQDSTWQAFWQTAVEGKKPREVGEALGLSVAAVYMAKSRVTAQLKKHIQQLQET